MTERLAAVRTTKNNQVVTFRVEKQIVVTYHRRCVEEI